MKCKHVQDLLPLYIGGDLAGKRAKLVSAHMQSCLACAGTADEYRLTCELVQLFSPPEFSEDVYSEMRQSVWHEIGQQSAQPSRQDTIGGLFQPRLRWAAAAVVLLAVCMFAFFLFNQRQKSRPQLAEVPGSDQRNTRDKQSTASSRDELVKAPGSDLTVREGARFPVKMSSVKPRVRPTVPRVAQSIKSSLPVRSAAFSPAVERNGAALTVTASDKTLRTEMQTKDPNIRIIWFSPQSSKQNSPSESSKGF
jgi:putative zinc finger protein